MVRISRCSSLDNVCRDNPPPECFVYLDELQVCVRMCIRVGVCGYVCVCARVKDCTNQIMQGRQHHT